MSNEEIADLSSQIPKPEDASVMGSQEQDAKGKFEKPNIRNSGFVKHVPRVKHRHLIKKPLVRQFLHEGHFYETVAAKDPSRFELFFDLVAVAMLYQLGKRVAEDFEGLTLALFLVIYAPVYFLWSDVRDFINVNGVDDVLQRIGILFHMGLWIGFAANAASLRLPSQMDVLPDPPESYISWGATVHLASVKPVKTKAYATLQSTIAFLLVAKLTRLLQQLIYAAWLPRFRASLLWSALSTALSMVLYLPLIWVRNETAFWVLMALGTVHEFGLSLAIKCLIRWEEQNAKGVGQRKSVYRPALNLNHHIERDALFLVLVLGESLLKIIYIASDSSIGLSSQFGRSILSLVCGFCLCNLVFDMDASHTYIHALRRHWFSAICYTYMIYPLSSAIILWASSLVAMVPETQVKGGAQWYFSGGLAASLVCLAISGSLHQGMDVPGSALLPRTVRLATRVGFAIIIALLPFADTMSDTTTLQGVSAGLMLVLVAIEVVGKIGAESQDFETAHNGVRLEHLTNTERGEEDIGIEGGLAEVERREIPLEQRLAWSA